MRDRGPGDLLEPSDRRSTAIGAVSDQECRAKPPKHIGQRSERHGQSQHYTCISISHSDRSALGQLGRSHIEQANTSIRTGWVAYAWLLMQTVTARNKWSRKNKAGKRLKSRQ